MPAHIYISDIEPFCRLPFTVYRSPFTVLNITVKRLPPQPPQIFPLIPTNI